MVKVVVTGFSSWEGSAGENPSELVVEKLKAKQWPTDFQFRFATVPVVFEEMVGHVMKVVNDFEADVVIMLGEYPGRAMITVERLAQNLIDATRYGLSDNVGDRPINRKVVQDGPVALAATVPIRSMTLAMRQVGVPSDISDSAGTFGCNLLFYGVLHSVKPGTRVGWLHLPALPSTASLDINLGMPSMSLDTQTQGVIAAIISACGDESEALTVRTKL